MTKVILISQANNSFNKTLHPDGFIQGFANALMRMGNEVLCILTNQLSQLDINLETVAFGPQVIISFNNAGMSDYILKNVNCPICLFFADGIAFCSNLDLLSKYREKYYFLHHSLDTLIQIKKNMKDIKEERNIIFGHATDVHKDQTAKQDIDISFVGSLGNWDKSSVIYFQKISDKDFSGKLEQQNLNVIKDNYIQKLEDFIQTGKMEKNDLPYWDEIVKKNLYCSITLTGTCQKRFEILSKLTDLNLKVISYPKGMVDVLSYDLNLFKSYDFTLATSLEETERIYNRSKISLNLPHAQAHQGFSWRVCDILASNACLLSDYRLDLEKLMKPYINIPMYTSSSEARELAIKLLRDDVWREEIIQASQKMIEENGRFEKKIKNISKFINIKLDCIPCEGTIRYFQKCKLKINTNKCEKLKNKICYKIWRHLDKKLRKKGVIQ